jgi:ERF superfamily
MDCVGLAGLRHKRDGDAAPDGAALTYARRYALFTLVGIAGEDDLDAPDLATPTKQAPGPEKPNECSNRRVNGGQGNPLQRASLRRDGKIQHATSAKPILGPEASAELRNRLLAELNDFGSGDEAAIWARRNLRVKNDLTEADARRIEEAFHARLAILQTGAGGSVQQAPAEELSRGSHQGARDDQLLSKVIDKSLLAVPEPRRVRDREHVKAVAKLPCLICGRQPSDAHHLRFAQHPALGRKVSDEFTVPLCRGHHLEVHRRGDETAWWKNFGIDPTIVARGLWLETHPLPTRADEMGIDGATSRVDVGTAKRDRSISKRGRNYKTKPIVAAGRQ